MYQNQDLELMNIIVDGIVGFIQSIDTSVQVDSVEFLVSYYWGCVIYLSVFDRYFHIYLA